MARGNNYILQYVCDLHAVDGAKLGHKIKVLAHLKCTHITGVIHVSIYSEGKEKVPSRMTYFRLGQLSSGQNVTRVMHTPLRFFESYNVLPRCSQ